MSADTDAITAGHAEAKRVFDAQQEHRWSAKQTIAQHRKAILKRLRAEVVSSGIGRYHGIHGFRELSHARSIFLAPKDNG